MLNIASAVHQSKASQDKFELVRTLIEAAVHEPKNILEIGLHKGFLTQTLREAFPEAQVVGIEAETKYLEFTDFRLIKGDSKTSVVSEEAKRYGPYDFMFIDGDHSYDGVCADWHVYSPMVRPGGVVAFHDTMRIGPEWEGKIGVRTLFSELRQHYQSIEYWAGGNAPGTGLILL